MPKPPRADELSLEIDGKNFRFWTEITVSLRIDGFDSVTFSAPFDPSDPVQRATFRPFSYKKVRVLTAGTALFTGVMMGIAPTSDATETSVTVECYSGGAILEDAHMPASHYPLEFSKLTLRQIGEKLCIPFGLSVSLAGDEGSKFDKVKLKVSDKVGPFLAELAKQRGKILSSTPDGGIVFRNSHIGTAAPIARLEHGREPVTGVTPTFAPQEYFSEVTCVAKTKRGRKGSQFTAKNTFLSGTGVVRPSVIELDDTDPGDIQVATNARIGRMYGNAAGYEVGLATWLTPDKRLYQPDDVVTLLAPRVMVYRETSLLVRAVELHQDKDQSKTAKLGLVLPGAFSGEQPKEEPWAG
jgi:prophage tail gpP-like protein